jgi:hypothetical protein
LKQTAFRKRAQGASATRIRTQRNHRLQTVNVRRLRPNTVCAVFPQNQHSVDDLPFTISAVVHRASDYSRFLSGWQAKPKLRTMSRSRN